MSMYYSDEIMTIFSSPSHVYKEGDEIHLTGYAGDPMIGEYIHLYFYIQKATDSLNYADNRIVQAKFSALGGVVLIAAADKFCSLVEGLTFQEALKYCDPERLQHVLLAPQGKVYSINFIIQAFYKAFEMLTVL